MRALTVDDLLPLDEFVTRRRELFDAHQRYLDRHRRVRIGPILTLLFENRQTLWFRVQEVLRIARLAEPAQVQLELNLYNRLLPSRDKLQAALLLDLNESNLTEELALWSSLRGDQLRLCLGDKAFPADLLTCRPEDRCVGTAHWVQFTIPKAFRPMLLDRHISTCVEVQHEKYQHVSVPLSEDVRQSLHDDLLLSERDAA